MNYIDCNVKGVASCNKGWSMDLISIAVVICAGMILLLLYWCYQKVKMLSDDLNMFTKEKEYQHEAMIVFDENDTIHYANQAARALFSLDRSYQKLAPENTIVLQKNASSKADDLFKVLKQELKDKTNSLHLKNVFLGISGAMKQANVYIDKNLWDNEQTITCIIDMKRSDSTHMDTSSHEGALDFFTGLPSQFSALTQINSVIKQSQKNSEVFTLFLFGVDDFRKIQSTLGLGFSNEIIRKIAHYFKSKKDEKRQVYRMDGDKFLMLIENLSDNNKIRQIAKETILDIQNLFNQHTSVAISSSVGIVKFPENGKNALKLINHAYITQAESESKSHANIEFFSVDYQEINRDIFRMSEEIRYGLKNNEFLLYYQPIFSLEDESILGAEALLRWEHPRLGLISPDKFLDIVKDAGLMVEIGEYVFQEAIKQRKKWDSQDLDIFQLTLNVSTEEIQDSDFMIQNLKKHFKKTGVHPTDFNLDISENDAMEHPEKTAVSLQNLKDLGLNISIDHFGLGVISLKYLSAFSLSTIKIDRALIFDLDTNLEHQKIVQTIIVLAHHLGIKVVAEGVETSKVLSVLYEYQCDFAQGYLFSKPLPANEFEALIAK